MPAMAKRNWISNRNRNHGRHSGTNPDTSGGRSVIHRAIPAPNDRYRSIYPHHDTPFGTEPAGSVGMTLKLLSLFRLMHPSALIPSTTALATLSPDGREKGILAGANVVMPNLSPREQREKYTLYDNKAAFGAEAAEGLRALAQQLETIGYRISTDRGDYH